MNNAFSYLGEVEPEKGNLIKGLHFSEVGKGIVHGFPLWVNGWVVYGIVC